MTARCAHRLLTALCLAGSLPGCGSGDGTDDPAGQSGSTGNGNGGSPADAGSSAGGSSSGGSNSALADSGAADAGHDSAGGNSAVGDDAGAGGANSDPDGAGACNAVVETHASQGALHVALCSPVSYQTSPPSSGNHYPVWAAFGQYAFPLPPGFWVHDLEHGAVVISYNCPDGCADDLAAATAWFQNLPVDAYCEALGAVQPRALLVPDPTLDIAFAASAWQHTLRADCFDEASFNQFYLDNVGHGLENICTSGSDFRGPDGMPTASLPPDCGQ